MKPLTTKEKIKLLTEILEVLKISSPAYFGICWAIQDLRQLPFPKIYKLIEQNFPMLYSFKKEENSFWFDTHADRIQAVEKQLQIINPKNQLV